MSISAVEFIKNLYGELPDLFKDEYELRTLWGKPDTRKALLAGLEDKGFGREQLEDVKQMIDAENSDVFDVLPYIAFASAPISREKELITIIHSSSNTTKTHSNSFWLLSWTITFQRCR